MSDTGDITFRCKICNGDVARARIGSDQYTHCDDEIVVRDLKVVSSSKYDHIAEPKILEVRVLSEKKGGGV